MGEKIREIKILQTKNGKKIVKSKYCKQKMEKIHKIKILQIKIGEKNREIKILQIKIAGQKFV